MDCFAGSPADSSGLYRANEINTDPLTGRRYFGTFKVSTLQVLFSEAPFTFEIFVKKDLSIQIQSGIIFPLESKSFFEQFFRSTGANSTASPKGFISYRNSPYNNHGMSFKLELRKYFNNFYYTPQFMYKFCHYSNIDFPVLINDKVMDQTESKHSHILGLGLMFGRQTYFMKQAQDWYLGAGFRARQISATVLKIEDPSIQNTSVYPDRTERSRKFYPFINFGFRLGFIL